MVYSDYEQRILLYRHLGKSYEGIVTSLAGMDHATTKAGVYKLIQRYKAASTITCAPGSGQTSKMTTEAVRIVKEQMEADDETTEGTADVTCPEEHDSHINDSPQVEDRARLHL